LPTARYGAQRDEQFEGRLRSAVEGHSDHHQISVEAIPGDGIAFDASEQIVHARDGWSERSESYLTSDQHPEPDPEHLVPEDDSIETDRTIDNIEAQYAVSSTKSDVPNGGHRAAHRRLDWFARAKNIRQYPSALSPPAKAEDQSSRLSPYLRFGVLSVRQVYQTIAENSGGERGRSFFKSRVSGGRYFRQKLAGNPALPKEAVNPALRGLYAEDEERDPGLIAAWKEGRTGYPMVDASMRALTQTGWLNFRMRAMVASFFGYLLKQWWRIGADFMYYHLIDADPAINYSQWQMQCGVVGTNPNRIYNPRKQAREYDPEGEFIHKYVPELRRLPAKFLDQPEKAPVHIQREYDVTIGDGPEADYPYPVVDYGRESTLAREQFSALAEQAQAALTDPKIRRRAWSQSREQRQRTQSSDRSDTTNAGEIEEQQQLSDF